VYCVNEQYDRNDNIDILSAQFCNTFSLNDHQALRYPALISVPKHHLRVRLAVLQEINKLLAEILPLVNFSLPPKTSVLADGVRAMRKCVFWHIKKLLWSKAVGTSACPSTNMYLDLDLFQAAKLFEQRKTDYRGKVALFSQAFQAMNSKPPNIFRLARDERAWHVRYVGMRSADAGGPYRDSIETMCKELQSPVLPLFIQCPNARESMGQNRDAFVPRPSSTRPLFISMYEFLGKLMGLAMRTHSFLPLNLPSIVWKPLVNDEVTEEDVKAIDILSFKVLEEMEKTASNPMISPEMFDEYMDFKFTTTGSDKKTYPLVPEGEKKKVTYANRRQFARAFIKFRLKEFSAQTAAMRRGIATVVPYQLLSLFTWQELEAQVCGRGSMDVSLLQENTQYSGCSANDEHIRMFWRMMTERSGYR